MYLPTRPSFTTDAAIAMLEEESGKATNDTVEAFMFSLNDGVVMSGQMLDKIPNEFRGLKYNRCGLWYKPFFYRHVQDLLKKDEHVTEIVPTSDFFHR